MRQWIQADSEHWALLDPVRFPSLQTLRFYTKDKDPYRIVDAIEGHPNLRNVYWEIRFQFMSECIRSLSSLLSGGDPAPATAVTPIGSGYNNSHLLPGARESHVSSAIQLSKYAIFYNVLPEERHPQVQALSSQKPC